MKKIIFFIFMFALLPKSYGAINFWEPFPNNVLGNYFQSLNNGWASAFHNSKEIQTLDGCRKIYSPLSQAIFIPTRSYQEWNLFQAYKPNGVSINSCIVHGSCGSGHNQTITGQPSNLCAAGQASAFTKDGTTFSWQCLGENGGQNISCSAREKVNCENLGQTTLLSFNGNIDHVLSIKVKIATESGKSITNISGKRDYLANKVIGVGGYYEEYNEGWHGDLSGNISYTPLTKSELEALKTSGEQVIFQKISGNVPRFIVKEQPSKANDWIATLDFYTPASGEQWINGKLVLGNYKCNQ